MSDERVVTLADAVQAWNFMPGMELVESDPGDPSFRLRPATRAERLRGRAGRLWRRATCWWRPRAVCTSADPRTGVVVMIRERWSWRRWRWERT